MCVTSAPSYYKDNAPHSQAELITGRHLYLMTPIRPGDRFRDGLSASNLLPYDMKQTHPNTATCYRACAVGQLSRHPLGSSALIIAFHKERKVPMKRTVQRLLGTPAAMSLVLLFFSICSSSCDKFKGDTGPAGPKLTGNLTGYVTLYDDYGRKLPDNSTVTITVENSDKATTSDISGKWTITELATGSYTLTFSKTGFGVYKRIGLGFTGGDVPKLVEIRV